MVFGGGERSSAGTLEPAGTKVKGEKGGRGEIVTNTL
jgi:hypothetical protein